MPESGGLFGSGYAILASGIQPYTMLLDCFELARYQEAAFTGAFIRLHPKSAIATLIDKS